MNTFQIGDRVSYPGHKGYGVIVNRDDKFYSIDWGNDRINLYPNAHEAGGLLYLVNTAAWCDFQERVKDRI